jgi:hypothetical protein
VQIKRLNAWKKIRKPLSLINSKAKPCAYFLMQTYFERESQEILFFRELPKQDLAYQSYSFDNQKDINFSTLILIFFFSFSFFGKIIVQF